MSKYSDILSRLYSVNVNQGVKLGLENVSRLNNLLGMPSHQFPTIHIAGTNGKGSVSSKIAKGLESRYSRVGLFCSPHISTFRERITINQQLISEGDVQKNFPKIWEIAETEKIPATFFELTTLLALKYFADKKIDIAVIETGVGGRLDATNIVNPSLSVITSIDFDHTEFLGTSLESIAAEKGGIIKPGVPVLLGPTATIVPVKEGCRSVIIREQFDDVESENRAIARTALELLKIPENAIRKALTMKLPCRRESIHFKGKDVILDVAHNPRGLERLFYDLKIPKNKLRIVFGLSKAKDFENCLGIIHKSAIDIHLVDAPNGRCATPQFLKEILVKLGVSKNRIMLHETISDSLSSAFSLAAASNQELIVCGTFFIMREARKFLGIEEPRDPVDLN